MKKSKNITIVSFVLFTFLPLISSSFISYYVLQFQILLQTLNWFSWLLISIFLGFTSAFALSPPTFLAVVFGYFLNFWAIPYLFIINFGAIFLVYIFCQYIDLSWLKNNFLSSEKPKKILEKLKKEELKIIFFTKLSPVLPFAITNLLFAVSGAKLKNIIMGGFLGMIPRTLLAVYSGTQAKEIATLIQSPNQGLFSKLLVFSLIIVSVSGIIFSIKKAFLKE